MLRGEEIIKIARLRKLEPWQEEKRYLQALIFPQTKQERYLKL
ncbi:hypothetical protein TCARB_0781 [Thermofilum adornatum 1505]|uniref:Uncharacterized protein n=1 Tax=Thermofilum adornatum 1505 TaxID=697581 RepID=A0A3G1A6M6_9CREN|nr:hypothetical protein TCARB_0781 [Thermofilum adornatum 1505]